MVDCSISMDVEPAPVFGGGLGQPSTGEPPSWEINLQGSGPLEARQEYEERARRQRSALEWKCPYCGRVHPQSAMKCWDGSNGCGAPKPLALSK